jgi:hypothetical protein
VNLWSDWVTWALLAVTVPVLVLCVFAIMKFPVDPTDYIDIRCPYCRRWMTSREATTQGACDDC